MKLYYDMFVPYMPDSVTSDKGEMVVDEKLKAGRDAMIALSEFQLTGNIMALYQSVLHACKYADKDFIDTILNLPDDMNLDNVPLSELVDDSAKILFKSINPEKYPFDLNKFVTYILTATHIGVMTARQLQVKAESSTPDKEVKP